MNSTAYGKIIEEKATNFLIGKGYEILERNAVYAGVEADVIAKCGDVIVFCEVKGREDIRYGVPAEAVGVQKQLRYRKCAAAYMQQKHAQNAEVRFDVIDVLGEDCINHYEGAFE